MEDALRDDRFLSFQQSGDDNNQDYLARRQRTARNRFLAGVSQKNKRVKKHRFLEKHD